MRERRTYYRRLAIKWSWDPWVICDQHFLCGNAPCRRIPNRSHDKKGVCILWRDQGISYLGWILEWTLKKLDELRFMLKLRRSGLINSWFGSYKTVSATNIANSVDSTDRKTGTLLLFFQFPSMQQKTFYALRRDPVTCLKTLGLSYRNNQIFAPKNFVHFRSSSESIIHFRIHRSFESIIHLNHSQVLWSIKALVLVPWWGYWHVWIILTDIE